MVVDLAVRNTNIIEKPFYNFKSLLKCLLVIGVVFFSLFSFRAGASETDVISTIYFEDRETFVLYSQLGTKNLSDTGVPFMTVDSSSQVGYWNETLYTNEFDIDKRQEIVNSMLTTIKESNLQPKGKNLLYNFIEGQDSATVQIVRGFESDLEADLIQGYKWWMPFQSPVSFFLGIMCWAIFFWFSASFTLDTLYMVNPVFRDWMKDSSIVGVEAKAVIKDMHTNGQWNNYLLEYLSLRSGSALLLVLVFMYLISGSIWDFIVFFVDLFGG